MANLQQEVFNLRRQVASLKKQIKGGYTPISEPKYTPQNLSRRVSSIQKKLDKGYTPIPRETANTVPLQTSGRYRRSPFEPSEFSYMTPSYPNTKSYTDQDLERIENAEMKLYRKPGEVLKPRYTPQNLSRKVASVKEQLGEGYTPISERGRKYIGYKGTESRLSELPYPVPPGEKYEQEPIALLGYVPKPHEYDFGGYRRTPFAPIAPFDPSNRRVAEAERKIDTLYRTSIRGYPTLKQKIAEAREELADAEAVRASYQDQEYDPMLPTQTPMNRNFMENLMLQAEEEDFRRFQEMKMLGVL